MRYKYIELYNYAGIYNGMFINDIKIDLTKCKSNKIIIRGDNGSGKSTLMNAIDPNPDSNDNFINGLEARKILCLVNEQEEYIIKYIHPVTSNGDRGTTKGYISKLINGQYVELNPNGNVSSCKDILYNEFGLDANFIALSHLSNDDKGLVEKKPAERKKFVNAIINALETYNNIYKVLNKKSSIFKSTINSLTYKIDNIGDETTLQLNLKSIENRITTLEQQKNSIIENAAALKLKMSEIDNILMQNNYDSIISDIKILQGNVKALNTDIGKILSLLNLTDYSQIENVYTEISKAIIQKETALDIKKQKIPSILSERESEYRELEDKKERLNSLQSDYNYMDIKNARDLAIQTINNYKSIFDQMGLMNINIISKEDFDAAMESIHYLKDLADALTSSYSLDLLHEVYDNRISIKNDMLNIRQEKDNNSRMKSILNELNAKKAVFEAKRAIANDLEKRPKECKIDTCPYIQSALEADMNYTQNEYNTLINQINDLNIEIDKSDRKINYIDEASSIIIQFESIERELKSKSKFIYKLPVRQDFVDTFLIRAINVSPFDDITNLYKYIDCGNMIEEYKSALKNLDTYNAEYKLYESKNQIIEAIIADVESLTTKTTELANQIDSINNEIVKDESELSNLKELKSKLETTIIKINNDLKPSLESLDNLNKIKLSLESSVNEKNNLQIELNKNHNTLGSIDNEIKNNTAERDKLKHSAELLKEYRAELEIYTTKYDKVNKIKYYSSPSTGIQTLFMELYMNKIITIANDLLSLLFNGEFTILPFIINDSEFRIPCIGSGLLHDDISSMSSAQKSMISMIISFSLLYQSSTKYNIIKLDEIDGALDTNNRNYFIILLDNLMKLLNCEQSFIVSHNNELNTNDADIILLKNSSNQIYSGNIIWQY